MFKRCFILSHRYHVEEMLFYTLIYIFICLQEFSAHPVEFIDMDWHSDNYVKYIGPKYVYRGDKLKITCQMSRFSPVTWTHNDELLSDVRRYEYDYVEGLRTSRMEHLTIHDVTFQDEGFYRCNPNSRNAYFVNVLPRDEDQKVLPSNSTEKTIIFLNKNDSLLILNCLLPISEHNSLIHWFKQGEQIIESDKFKIFQTKLFIFNATTSQDSGQYYCRTDEKTDKNNRLIKNSHTIDVYGKISIQEFSSNSFQFIQNEKFNLTCLYTGYPPGKINWVYKNQLSQIEKINENHELITKVRPGDTLIINELQLNQTGSYTCVVKNNFSKDEKTVKLKVRANELSISGPHILIESRDIHVYCNLSRKESLTATKWFKDNIELSSVPGFGKTLVTENPSDGVSLLKIISPKIQDVGNYECLYNGYNATTQVRTRPLLTPFLEFQSTNFRSAIIVEGDNLTLNCQFLPGYERDGSLEWWTYGEFEEVDTDGDGEISIDKLHAINLTDPRITIEKEDSTSVLTILNVKPSDRMFYVCKAHNLVGTFNNTILLRVRDRYAALWPLMGILTEVIILCIVIFVYEKRRVKPDFDDNMNISTPKKTTDDGNRSPNDRSSRSHDVRQRK